MTLFWLPAKFVLVPYFLHSCPMEYDVRFGPYAQTPTQRAYVLQQLQTTKPRLKTQASAYAQQLYTRYIAGEITWADVRQLLDTKLG